MTEDAQFVALLRAAVPPVVTTAPTRDLWPSLLERCEERPPGSWLDLGVAVGVVVVFLIRPDWLVFLAYHF